MANSPDGLDILKDVFKGLAKIAAGDFTTDSTSYGFGKNMTNNTDTSTDEKYDAREAFQQRLREAANKKYYQQPQKQQQGYNRNQRDIPQDVINGLNEEDSNNKATESGRNQAGMKNDKNSRMTDKETDRNEVEMNNSGSNSTGNVKTKVSDRDSNYNTDNYENIKVQLDSNNLRQAFIYSEILGKPKCKNRRRQGNR